MQLVVKNYSFIPQKILQGKSIESGRSFQRVRDMGTVVALLQFLSLVLVLVSQTQAHKSDWSHTVPYEEVGKAKLTHLHFYFHDILSGKNPTGVMIAQAPSTKQSTMGFGSLAMIDDPLTEGPELTSKLVGRAQGLVGFASQTEMASIMALSYVFMDKKFNGSTLSILTRNPIMNPIREFPVVGGTGIFQFARGVANIKTYWVNATSGDAIVEYNVTVIHY